MKQYKKYMDNVEVSDTLHQRLLELEAPAKRPAAWKKYGAAAAALALAVGIGGWGLGGWGALTDHLQPAARPESVDLGRPEPDIITVAPGESLEPGMKTIGGYEVQQGEMAAYYLLPYIEYGMADSVGQMALDWDVPPGSVKRELTQADFAALFGGEDALSTHLNWGDYTLTGWAAWNEDGSFWGAFLNGYKGELDHFEFAFTAGDALPPTCIAYGEDGVVNQLWDVPVTAWGHDGKDGCGRRVEFLHDGYGFRFDLTATDVGQAEELVSRLTRWILTEGVAAESVTVDGTVLVNPWGGLDSASSGPAWPQDGSNGADEYDSDCPYCADGTAHSHPQLPKEALDPSCQASAKGPDDPAAGGLPDGDPIAYEPQAVIPS